MNQPSTQDLRASLLGLFESSDALFGAQIVPLLKNKFATVRFGPPGLKLSEFISEHVPEIVEDRNPGSDSIYRLSAACGEEPGRKDCSHGESVKKRASRDELEVLKTFSSPHGNRKIVVNTDRKILKVIPSRQDVSPGWTLVSSLTPAVLEDFARRFAHGLPDQNVGAELTEGIGEPQWWLGHRQKLTRRKLLVEFSRFRGDLIRKALDAKLDDLGLTSLATVAMERSTDRESSRVRTTERNVTLLRRVALRAVERMSEDQLKVIPVTLGLLYDLMNLEETSPGA